MFIKKAKLVMRSWWPRYIVVILHDSIVNFPEESTEAVPGTATLLVRPWGSMIETCARFATVRIVAASNAWI
jgi:hypothetical protein